MTGQLLTMMENVGAPGRDFWEHELEIPAAQIAAEAARPGYLDHWVAARSGRQTKLLRRLLAFGGIKASHDQVRLEGVQVIAVQAGPRLEVFRVLWEHYLEDLQSGLEADQFRTLPLKDLASALESRLGRPYPDETTVRRYVNRLQSDLEAAVKRKLGLPVDREDIIQTRAWQGQAGDDYGYRLNPYRVLIGPHLPAPTRSAS